MIIYRKHIKSGLYIRKFDRYINADSSSGHSSTGDDPSRLEGYLDSSWVDEGVTTQVNSKNIMETLDTHVVCGFFRPDVTGTWDFRLRSNDAGYLWFGDDAKPLEWDLDKNNALCDNGGGHTATNVDASITLTAGVFYPFKAMTGDRGGGDDFVVDFSGPAGSTQALALTNIGRDGTGFYFHNPYAPNGYNLNS